MGIKYYTRTCIKCGDCKTVTYKPKGNEMCSTCRKKELGANLSKNKYKDYKHIVYWYFCPTCEEVQGSNRKKKTAYCCKCSRRYSKSKHKQSKFEFSFDTITTICIYKWEKPKRKYYKPKLKPKLKPKPKPKRKQEDFTIMPEKEKVTAPKLSKEKEDEMIQEWLKKNKVKVIESKDFAPDYTGCKMGGYVSDYY